MGRFFKVQTLLDEIRANGITQARGTFIEKDFDGRIVAACAVGQAAINLGVDANDLSNILGEIKVSGPKALGTTSLGSLIIHLNDQKKLSYAQIADYVEDNFPDILHARTGLDKTVNYKL